MHEQHRVVMTGCTFCRKHFGTMLRLRRLITHFWRQAADSLSAKTGQLTITGNDWNLVMDVAVEDFNGDGAVYTGTYSAPGYNITDPTATVPTPSTGKFLNAFGSGNVVFATGSSLNAPAGTKPHSIDHHAEWLAQRGR